MDRFLTVLEVSQKQNYIFRTDRLAENIGASIIIRQITEFNDKSNTLLSHYRDHLFYEGGGKSVFEFESAIDARKFTSVISENVLRKYPGVELFIATQKYDIDHDSCIEAINQLFASLEKKKSERKSSAVFYGAGITERCSDTQLPAISDIEDFGFLSDESVAKLHAAMSQREAYEDVLPEGDWKFASEFDDLGGTQNKKSYIAVVAMDGNGMGKRIKQFREDFAKLEGTMPEKEFNERYRQDFSALSSAIDQAYRKAVRNVTQYLADHMNQFLEEGIVSVRKGHENVLPFRPLILSGDDICFVTDARIGLTLTEVLLDAVEKNGHITTSGMDFHMHACAGIAMVKSHYPFFRAHELAEELCSSAKTAIAGTDQDEPVIDWHIVQGEIEGSISEIRRDKYDKGRMTAKPYFMNEGHGIHSVSAFRKRFDEFSGENIGRGTIKEYRDALSEGGGAVDEYWNHKRLNRKNLKRIDDGLDFDVIEMLDIYQNGKAVER